MKKRLTLLTIAALLFAVIPLSAEEAKPFPWASAGKDLFEKLQDKPIIVYVKIFDHHYQINQRERWLFDCPQMEQLKDKFHWVQYWSAFGSGKKMFKPNGQAAFIVYKNKDEIVANINLLAAGNGAILRQLASIGNVELEGDIPYQNMQGYLNSVGMLLREYNTASQAGDLQTARTVYDKCKAQYPDFVMLPHMANDLRRIEFAEEQNERFARLPDIAKTVYIAPDIETCLSLIGEWNDKRIFPVMLWHDYYTPLFLQRFQPEQVYFAEPVSRKPEELTEQMVWASAGGPHR
ncbi:MAG: hypothetical protein U5N86_12120 [Planctomycetota bacterium]|nr:hypothetical protein [Planctomycetota bacterium]